MTKTDTIWDILFTITALFLFIGIIAVFGLPLLIIYLIEKKVFRKTKALIYEIEVIKGVKLD